jgi:hypothetical protein
VRQVLDAIAGLEAEKDEERVLSKSDISPGNLNRRLRIEAMYFL